MKTIAIVSQKGGAGKTTLAIHLAAYAASIGIETVLFDTDPQATAMSWAEWRMLGDVAGGPEVVDCASPRLLPGKVERARELGAELVVIDTPPSGDAMARAACVAADLVLIPCRPQAFDLDAIATTVELAVSTNRFAFVVWVGGPVRARLTYVDANGLVTALHMPIADLMLPARAALHRASGSGRTAWELEPDSPAAHEAVALAAWALASVGVSTRRPVAVAA